MFYRRAMVTIRDATDADIDAVLGFWAIATTVASTTDDVDGVRQLLAHDPGALIAAVDDDRRIVATVITGWDGWRATMYRLAVAPERRREGIASELVHAAEQRLRAHGARRFHLIVEPEEAAARAFWESAGYTPTPQLRLVKAFT